MKEFGKCRHCQCPMEFAGAGDKPEAVMGRAASATPAAEDTSRFWIRCPKCERFVLQDTREVQGMLDSEQRAGSDAAGPIERTLRAWGIPYTPGKP